MHEWHTDREDAFRMKDVLRVMDGQAKMSKTARSQRYARVALMVVIMLVFAANLASSVPRLTV